MSEGKDRLKQIRKALGLSQGEFAESIGIPVSTINSIEGGKQKLSVRVALAMKNKIIRHPDGRLSILKNTCLANFDDAHLNIDWLVAGLGDPFDKTINNDVLCIKSEGKEILLPKGKNIVFYTVSDDSMYPDFLVNEFAAVNTDTKEIVNGDIYLIEYDNMKFLRKIYIINKDKYNVVAINEKVMAPIEVKPNDIKVIGKWIYKIGVAEKIRFY